MQLMSSYEGKNGFYNFVFISLSNLINRGEYWINIVPFPEYKKIT